MKSREIESQASAGGEVARPIFAEWAPGGDEWSLWQGRRSGLRSLSEGAIGAEFDQTTARIGENGGIDHFGFALAA